MNPTLRNFCFALLALAMALPAAAASLSAPKMIAVYFTADWCPSCKILGPVLEEARAQGKLDRKDILFVKMDFSNAHTTHQSGLLANALGMAPFVKKQGGGTGYVAVLAADKTTELLRFGRKAASADIVAAFNELLESAPAAQK